MDISSSSSSHNIIYKEQRWSNFIVMDFVITSWFDVEIPYSTDSYGFWMVFSHCVYVNSNAFCILEKNMVVLIPWKKECSCIVVVPAYGQVTGFERLCDRSVFSVKLLIWCMISIDLPFCFPFCDDFGTGFNMNWLWLVVF